MTSAKEADQGTVVSASNVSNSRSPTKDKFSSAPGSDAPARTSKKRRKVNHGETLMMSSGDALDSLADFFASNQRASIADVRCVKRNIGHLCHDEPREGVKKPKSEPENGSAPSEATTNGASTSDAASNAMSQQISATDAGLNLAPPPLPPNRAASTPSTTQADPVSAPQLPALTSGNQSFVNYDNLLSSSSQNNFQDMHHFHPSYMFNTPEVSNEYNLFNDFLNNNLMDDGSFYGGGDLHTLFSDASLMNSMGTLTNNTTFDPNTSRNAQLLPPPAQPTVSNSVQRPTNSATADKARERYLMAAADPAGNDSPEERMNKLLKAKMDAGLLRPFNYVKGYARLNQYMEQNLQQVSRVRILRQLDRFRPKFRERVQKLNDMELVRVEMWFDKSLMEYDRVFASMAIPACCWRRTGEIYRGNKEMARLIHAPMSKLRDGNIALHEIIAEPSLVSYWEKFGAIAFDHTQKAILTSCSIKNPDPTSKDPEIRCCFSFTVKRDMWNIVDCR
ncbi:sequence-specific DNA binding RNA polymerase II transcription factor [Ascochyta rabiei]|uniref:Sequence-specific DNA binding RNA polymerase II transcription factor n=1 Tax=Didymella rabiei TaxID=5454 RepID=A0A163A1A8_DIDRA|nr:sequence-specific DNA binding RNA polymerase II transcription factor [Ascochyta rabiei]